MGLSEGDRAAIVERYSERLKQYGVDLRTLNVGKHYEKQHAVHASIGDLEGKSVLDIGCGLAHYYEYLRGRGIHVDYIGYDLVPPFIEIDRERYPEATFEVHDITGTDVAHEADYVVMCQVFNNKYSDSDNVEVVKQVLARAFSRARTGLSVDMLSTYVNYRDDKVAYFDPAEMFDFAKSIAPYVKLRHDYAPHHFTLFLYREQQP